MGHRGRRFDPARGGGLATDFSGRQFDPFVPEIAATNSRIHDELIRALSPRGRRPIGRSLPPSLLPLVAGPAGGYTGRRTRADGRTMYLSFYGFRKHPFNLTADPGFLFPSPQHREALSFLQYGIAERKGSSPSPGRSAPGKRPSAAPSSPGSTTA